MFSRFFIHSKKPAASFLYYYFLTLIWDIKKLCTDQQAAVSSLCSVSLKGENKPGTKAESARGTP